MISKIVEDGRAIGLEIKVRDIYCSTLCEMFDDKEMIYRCLFDIDGKHSKTKVNSYLSSKKMSFVSNYIKPYIENKISKGGKNSGDDISFEENKAEIIRLIKQTQEDRKAGKIDAKDALKIEADLRVKLNDKFSVTEEVKDQIVVVNIKYNAVCDCGKEIYIPTKEDLMKQYNLIENKQ